MLAHPIATGQPSRSAPPAEVQALARQLRLPVADLAAASPQAVSLIAERWARQFRVVPLSASDQEIVVASADPLDFDCERTLAFATGRRVRFAVAAPDAIQRRLEELYGGAFREDGDEATPDGLSEVQHLTTESEAAPSMAFDDTSASAT